MPLETVDIDGVEFFAVGNWNGDTFTESDLDEMVRSYEATRGEYTPFLKISHDDSQKLAENSGLSVSELPALGIVENVRRLGNKLLADFKKVPKKIAELMKVGAYRTRSAEIWSNVDWAGGKLPLMLKAISVLGAEAPAVSGLNTLDDIIALYKGAHQAQTFNSSAEAKDYLCAFSANSEDNSMDKVKELEAKLAESEKQFAAVSAELKTLKESQDKEGVENLRKEFAAITAKVAELETSIKSEKERADKAEAKVKEYSEAKRDLEITTKVEDLVRKGKLSPAQKDFAIAFVKNGLAAGELKFAHGDKEYKSPEELLFAMIEAGAGVTLPTEQKTEAGAAHRDAKDGVIGIETDRKVREYMEKHKVDYKAAYVEISKAQA